MAFIYKDVINLKMEKIEIDDLECKSVVKRNKETKDDDDIQFITTMQSDDKQVIFKTKEGLPISPGDDVKVVVMNPQTKL